MSSRNNTVSEINKLILEKISGQITHYKSVDTVYNITLSSRIFKFLCPSGLPPHDLMLKVDIPIMPLRNLNPLNIRNGITSLIKELWDNIIMVIISMGSAAGQ